MANDWGNVGVCELSKFPGDGNQEISPRGYMPKSPNFLARFPAPTIPGETVGDGDDRGLVACMHIAKLDAFKSRG